MKHEPRSFGVAVLEERGVKDMRQAEAYAWILDRGSPQLFAAACAKNITPHQLQKLVEHEWLAQERPGWLSAHRVYGYGWPVPASSFSASLLAQGRAVDARGELVMVRAPLRDEDFDRPAYLARVEAPNVLPARERYYLEDRYTVEMRPEALLLGRALPRERAALLREAELFTHAHEISNPFSLHVLGIMPTTLSHSVFQGTWRIADDHMAFPHVNTTETTGFEIARLDKRLYGRPVRGVVETPGALEGIWHSRAHRGDRRVVVTARAVDALSYHQLHPAPNTRYVSVHALPTPHQTALLDRVFAKMPAGSEIVAAMSNSLREQYLLQTVERLAAAHRMALRQHSPPSPPHVWDGYGWNTCLSGLARDSTRDPDRMHNRRQPSGVER